MLRIQAFLVKYSLYGEDFNKLNVWSIPLDKQYIINDFFLVLYITHLCEQ